MSNEKKTILLVEDESMILLAEKEELKNNNFSNLRMKEKTMSYIDWKEEFNVAVKQFNDDHKKLISYLNELHRGLVSGLGIQDMGYILKGLVDYTVTHFKNEEKLMVKHNYPDYEIHKQEHDELVRQVSEFYDEFQEGKKTFSIELLSFLHDWVTGHILGSDMKYKPFFKEIAKEQKG